MADKEVVIKESTLLDCVKKGYLKVQEEEVMLISFDSVTVEGCSIVGEVVRIVSYICSTENRG